MEPLSRGDIATPGRQDMRLAQALTLLLLPLPLLVWAVVSGHYRRCLMPFVAVAGIYVFLCAGSGDVIFNPSLYSDAYFYTLVLTILGCYGVYAVLLIFGRSVQVDYEAMEGESSIRPALLLFVPLWAYSLAIMALYFFRHGAPPLFALWGALGPVDFYAVRGEKTTSLAEGVHWYVLGLQTVPYFIFIYSYILKLQLRTRAATILSILSFVVAVAFATSFANKDVLLHLILFVVLAKICVGGGGLRLRVALLYGVLALGSVFVFLRLYLLDRSTWLVLKIFGSFLAERLLYAYTEAHAFIVKIFPNEHRFFDGSAFANPGGILPFTPIELNRYLGYRVFGHVANYSTASISHGYANFGVPGIFLILGIVTFQLIVLQAVFRRLPRRPLFASIYVLVAERAIRYGSEPIQNVIAEELLLFLAGTVVLYYLLRDLGTVLDSKVHTPSGATS